MAQFVLVASGISSEHFEKAMEIKIRSREKVSFVPQAGQQHGVVTHGMLSVKTGNVELLNTVRFEWDQSGEEFGAEIVHALAGHQYQHQHEQRHEPAA